MHADDEISVTMSTLLTKFRTPKDETPQLSSLDKATRFIIYL